MTTAPPTRDPHLTPNHHAEYPAFAGLGGLLAALTFSVGRTADADLAIRLTEAGPVDDVLDVGCGPGVAVRRAAAIGVSSVVGIDPAPVMLRLARTLSARHRNLAVRYMVGAAEELPVPDGSASVLWSLATVHHWCDLTAGLAEAGRVLRPGGRFLVIERHVRPGATGHGTHGWTEDQARRFAESCTAAGFTDVVIGQHRAGQKPVLAVVATRP
jgi:ubiquinone/menaquinone biosynthesis C-methylase UbiE